MSIPSKLELIGSPVELGTWSPTTNFFWDPTPEFATGEVPSSPTCKVLKYNPEYPADTSDVTAALIPSGATIGSGSHSSQVQVSVIPSALVVGYNYRVELTCLGSSGTAASRFFVIICKY